MSLLQGMGHRRSTEPEASTSAGLPSAAVETDTSSVMETESASVTTTVTGVAQAVHDTTANDSVIIVTLPPSNVAKEETVDGCDDGETNSVTPMEVHDSVESHVNPSNGSHKSAGSDGQGLEVVPSGRVDVDRELDPEPEKPVKDEGKSKGLGIVYSQQKAKKTFF